VAVGGAAGTAIRAALSAAVATGSGEWPWATLGVNIGGAACLGLLVAWTDRPWLRESLGVGLLGGFTTYSAFAWEILGLASAGRVGLAVTYAVVSVVTGVAAAALGGAVARRRWRR
jgi:CrcB protein